MVPMHLIPPTEGRRKWRIRFQNHDGAWRKVQGYDDRNASLRLSQRITTLIAAKLNGEPPPAELAPWIAAMEDTLSKKLASLGLLDQRRKQQGKPITGHIEDYEKHVAARRNNTNLHGAKTAAKVKLICQELKVETYGDLSLNDAEVKLKDLSLSPATMRSYLVALRDFGAWMVRDKRAFSNPFENAVLPDPVPKSDRKPYTVAEFQTLMKHMATVTRYENQLAAWTGEDRRLLYWTAVKTALRLGVLRKMTVSWLHLETSPASITVPARVQKNRTELAVPIPADLAAALKKYCENKLPGAGVFPIPGDHGVVDMLRRDLKAAGLAHEWEGTSDTRDFHTFRHTAITWWLEVDGLSQLTVQRLAGLKTLAVVQKYSRGFRLDSMPWLNAGPSLDIKPEEANAATA